MLSIHKQPERQLPEKDPLRQGGVVELILGSSEEYWPEENQLMSPGVTISERVKQVMSSDDTDLTVEDLPNLDSEDLESRLKEQLEGGAEIFSEIEEQAEEKEEDLYELHPLKPVKLASDKEEVLPYRKVVLREVYYRRDPVW